MVRPTREQAEPTKVELVVLTREQFASIIEEAVSKALAMAPVAPPREIFDSKGAGQFIGRSAKVVERLARAGKIPAFRLGQHWRFKRSGA